MQTCYISVYTTVRASSVGVDRMLVESRTSQTANTDWGRYSFEFARHINLDGRVTLRGVDFQTGVESWPSCSRTLAANTIDALVPQLTIKHAGSELHRRPR